MTSERSKPNSPPPLLLILAAFALAPIGFVVAAVYGEVRASNIDREAERIETNALPSVEHLAAARAALWHLALASNRYLDEPEDERSGVEGEIDRASAEVARELQAEFATPQYPGEEELQHEATHALEDVDHLLTTMRRAPPVEARERHAMLHRLQGTVERADAALDRLVAINAAQGHAEIHEIGQVRAGSVRVLLALNVACVAFAWLAAVVAIRALQRRRRIELAHDALLVAQATELEGFASRVAHDMLSPLSALAFTLSAIRRNADKGASIAAPLERARACLARSQALVHGVMDFARSGGAPANAQADLRGTLDGVLEELQGEERGVDVRVEGVDGEIPVACSSGVLTSILSNLLRNAVKFMAGQTDRRLVVRALRAHGGLRVEVEDNGPGLPPGLEEHVFEPYVRSPDSTKAGLGLGLATVKRFVEAHRGRVGVDSAPAQGCLFWFELPLAPAPESERHPAAEAESEPRGRDVSET